MFTFLAALAFMTAMYFVYGKYVDRVFAPDASRPTPATTLFDGVDYVPMSNKKIFLIQFLNIAGLGPIFGAIMGAMYGPVVFLWIAFGTIFGGAVHDYLSGMISLRSDGKSLPEIIGDQLGLSVKQVMRLFTIILMILVGVVFVSGPADLLTKLTGGAIDYRLWIAIILCYYIAATLFPVDKIIGRIYPLFGFALLFMAAGILTAMLFHHRDMTELTWDTLGNRHPAAASLPLLPMLFISVACGAISGFHATQSPLMARCMKNETAGRKIFFGAMVAEGIVAMIWAAAAMAFFKGLDGFHAFMETNNNSAAVVVDKISHDWLGAAGAILALLGVVAAPITSADTAFRSARLIIADILRYPQKRLKNRIVISAPLFALCFVLLLLSQKSFDIIWRYFAWSNQTLAVFTLWAITVYLAKEHKNYLLTLIPALFMTLVCSTYILIAKEGFSLPHTLSYALGGGVTLLLLWLFFKKIKPLRGMKR
ncbi:MAG: carbon starvation protein A [Prevotellaceae bacterium]|jgi:carbon starvation protein CstA|nr:carbon starvation protein A [Prevotellaceae bacterium]